MKSKSTFTSFVNITTYEKSRCSKQWVWGPVAVEEVVEPTEAALEASEPEATEPEARPEASEPAGLWGEAAVETPEEVTLAEPVAEANDWSAVPALEPAVEPVAEQVVAAEMDWNIAPESPSEPVSVETPSVEPAVVEPTIAEPPAAEPAPAMPPASLWESTPVAEMPTSETSTPAPSPAAASGADLWDIEAKPAALVAESPMASAVETPVAEFSAEAGLAEEPPAEQFPVEQLAAEQFPAEELLSTDESLSPRTDSEVAADAWLNTFESKLEENRDDAMQVPVEESAEEPIEQPALVEPVVEQPMVEEVAAIVQEQPVCEEPRVDEPIVEQPMIEQPLAEQPLAEQPAEEFSADEYTAGLISESLVEEYTPYESPMTEESAEQSLEAPVVEQPAVEDAIVEQPVVEPVAQSADDLILAEQPSKEAPVSFLEKYADLLPADDEPIVEPAPVEAVMPIATPSSNPFGGESTDGENEEGSIDDYMAGLMRRMRGESTEPAPAPTAALLPQAAPAEPQKLSVDDVPTPAAPVAPLKNLDELRSGRAREKVQDMSSLRDLANQSARHAIGVSQNKAGKEKAIVNFAISAIAVGCGGFLAVTAKELISLQLAGGTLMFGASAFWCFKSLMHMLGVLTSRPAGKSAKQAEPQE